MPKKLTTHEFIERAKNIHKNKYDYSKVEYINAETKVCIICSEHGEFWQKPSNHLFGKGCLKCAEKRNTLNVKDFIIKSIESHQTKYDYSKVTYDKMTDKVCIVCPEHGEFWQTATYHLKGGNCPHCKKMSNLDFVERAKNIHCNKYDYSKVEYIDYHTKVCIICPEHGEFWQKPAHHLAGNGCRKCANMDMTTQDFIEKAKQVHGDKYDYSKVEYKKSNEKICIICPEHGEFWQTPNSHLHGRGCGKCGLNTLRNYFVSTTQDFIEKAKQVHGDKYDYSKVNYCNCKTKVCMICPEHGEFWQTPNSHLQGRGCNRCGIDIRSAAQKFTSETFMVKAKQVHGDKYDYSKVEYTDYDINVCIICPEHGEFWQTPDSHLQGSGCQKCARKESKQEIELVSFIKKILPKEEVKIKQRGIVSNMQEIDVYIPNRNLAFEYNGLRWHSEQFGKDKNYHLNKLNKCKEENINLIHIFEDEWLKKREIVESKIKYLLNVNNDLTKVNARDCTIKEITSNISKIFLEKNHIQGFANATVHIGCFIKDKVVGVMSFRKETKNSNNWELVRFATDTCVCVRGGGSKLFQYFIKTYNPEEVKSFADRRWTLNEKINLYTKLGFKLEKSLKPDYKYHKKGINRVHKFNFRKKILLKKYPNSGLTEDMTEYEMSQKLGFYRIWDCGLFKYVWKNN